jgi:hypothetical protein
MASRVTCGPEEITVDRDVRVPGRDAYGQSCDVRRRLCERLCRSVPFRRRPGLRREMMDAIEKVTCPNFGIAQRE